MAPFIWAAGFTQRSAAPDSPRFLGEQPGTGGISLARARASPLFI